MFSAQRRFVHPRRTEAGIRDKDEVKEEGEREGEQRRGEKGARERGNGYLFWGHKGLDSEETEASCMQMAVYKGERGNPMSG